LEEDLDGRITTVTPQSNDTIIDIEISVPPTFYINKEERHDDDVTSVNEEDGSSNTNVKENITSAGVHRTDRYSRTIFNRDGKTNNNEEDHTDLSRKELLDLLDTAVAVGPAVPISFDDRGWVQADYISSSLDSDDYPELVKLIFHKDDNGRTLATKLFNAALLTASFGYVFYTVFNIDRGMTRGWSPAEITMRIPLDTWASYENSLSEKPVATKTIINIVIYLLGDWLSQTLFQKKDVLNFDATRTIKNGLVGMCFGPVVHEYYEFSDWILPVEGLTLGITNRAFKILMDQTIYLSVKCSIYIIAIAVLNGESVDSGVDNVKNRLKPIMFTAWKFWPLVHCVTYGLIPARHRILWVNSVDLVWNAILASKARGDDNDIDDTNDDVLLDDDDNRQDLEMKDHSGGGGGLDNIFQRLGSRLSSFNSSPQNEDRDDTVIEEHIVTSGSNDKGDR
jgi:protein Mpv17